MHEYEIGDKVYFQLHVPDRRWWKRLFNFITFRAPPVITENLNATITSIATMTVPTTKHQGRFASRWMRLLGARRADSDAA